MARKNGRSSNVASTVVARLCGRSHHQRDDRCPATFDRQHNIGGDHDACMACGHNPRLPGGTTDLEFREYDEEGRIEAVHFIPVESELAAAMVAEDKGRMFVLRISIERGW